MAISEFIKATHLDPSLIMSLVMLHLQTENGGMHTMWAQVVLRSFPRHLCSQS
jgi:hypothetical protein